MSTGVTNAHGIPSSNVLSESVYTAAYVPFISYIYNLFQKFIP